MDPLQNATYRLAALVFADMVGYSRLPQKVAVQFQAEMQTLAQECLEQHQGRLVSTAGDGFFAEFPAAYDAVLFSLELQQRLAVRNAAMKAELWLRLRIGIHFGDVLARGKEIDGTNVVIAARTEPLASPGGICMTQQVWEQVREELPYPAARLGKLRIKGFPRGLNFYNLYAGDAGTLARLWHRTALFFNWPGRVPTALVLAGILIAIAIWLRPFAEPLLEEIFPPAPATLVKRAVKELARFDLDGHIANAMAELQKSIDRGASQNPPPDWMPEAHAWLSFAYWRRFLQTRSSEDRQKAFDQSAAATNALSPVAYQVQGLVALNKGELNQAFELLSRANELFIGQNCDVLVKLADVNLLRHQPEDAAANIASAYAVVGKPWNAYISLGGYEYNHANTAAALTNFQQALELAPDSPIARHNLVSTLLQMDKPAQALKVHEALMHKLPGLRENPEFCSSQGSIYLALGNQPVAADWFMKAASLRPTDYRFFGNAGLALLEVTNRRAEARECFTKAVQAARLSLKDNPDCLILAHIGLYLAALGQTNAAQDSINEALKQCGDNLQVHDAAAQAFTLLGATNQLPITVDKPPAIVPSSTNSDNKSRKEKQT